MLLLKYTIVIVVIFITNMSQASEDYLDKFKGGFIKL